MNEKETNYERYFSSFEKVVEVILKEVGCHWCVWNEPDQYSCNGKSCREGITAWLNKEVKDG